MTWLKHADEALRMFLENMVAEGKLAQQVGFDASPAQIVAASSEALRDIIERSFPLARVMDSSDLVLHAEGPAVRESPSLSAFNWLAGTAEKTIRRLSGNLFELLDRDARALSRALDLRLTGMAPGSLYLGFAIAEPESDLINKDDEPVFARLRVAVRQLPTVTGLIDDEGISPEVAHLLPDAAERDATLSALKQLAPTGHRGIHTLDLTAPGSARGVLSQRERVVLTQALKRPELLNRKTGEFTGEVREIDLDARRLHLRNVSGVGSLRCVLTALESGQAKTMLGEFARVRGEFEADRSGRPRLLLVDRIEALPRAHQTMMWSGGDSQD